MTAFSRMRSARLSTAGGDGRAIGGRPEKTHATPRSVQLEQGCSRLHFSFFRRHDSHDTGSWRESGIEGGYRARVMTASAGVNEVLL